MIIQVKFIFKQVKQVEMYYHMTIQQVYYILKYLMEVQKDKRIVSVNVSVMPYKIVTEEIQTKPTYDDLENHYF